MEEDRLDIETPEHVRFTYELAGIGSRFAAAVIDYIIQMLIAVLFAMALAVVVSEFPALADRAAALFIIAAAAGTFVFLGYFIIFEMLWNGQSPGKRAARIRVIRDDGTPITFVESAIRNLLRIVDFLPFYYGVGLLSILLSRRNKRLGDFAAGTVVVKIPAGDELEPLPEVPSDGHYVEKTKILAPYVSQLTQPEINAIQHFMERRAELEPRTRRRLAMQIADSVRQKLADHAHAALPSDPEQMLAVLYAAIVEHQRRI